MSYNFNIANDVIYRELVGCTKEILITNRAPNGTVVIEAPTIADKDFFAIATGTSTGSITFQHGTTAGNRVTMATAQSDLGNLTYSDQDGIQMLNMPFIAVPTSAGNNEMSLVYTRSRGVCPQSIAELQLAGQHQAAGRWRQA